MEGLSFLLAAVLVLLFYILSLGVYRVWLSPVAEIPGPVLAKLTYWYEFYWDVVRVGQYTFHIRDLHSKYGPIVRINPHEVHIDDPDFYDELYATAATGKKRNKWRFFVDSFGIDDAIFATVDHDRHRIRRTALHHFFSKAKTRALQGRVEHVIQKLLSRMREFQERKEPMPIGLAFTALTSDVASSYAFDVQTFRTDAPDFSPDLHIAGESVAKASHLMKQFPWLLRVFQSLPVSWVMAMSPDTGAYMNLQSFCQSKTKEIETAYHKPDYKPPEQTTIFHEILSSPHLPESEKYSGRLWQDAQSVVVAGTVTTTVTLSDLFFFLLEDSKRLMRLRSEIFAAIPDKDAALRLHVLEGLPFLTACLMETLRFSNGVTTRLQRIDPEKPMVFHAKTDSYGSPAAQDQTYVLPPGTPVSMTGLHVHYNPRIYPEPLSFVPERWLQKEPSTGKDQVHRKLDKYFVPFSKGTRACLGLNLAWAELYLVTAMVFRRYGSKETQMAGDEGYMELFDSSFERDIEIVGDGTSPIVREPLKGIKAKIHPCDVGADR